MDTLKISKLISYWLRHSPNDASLVMDEYGWVSISQLISAIYEKGFQLTIKHLVNLNESTDKRRWVIDESKDKIRASHGHSVTIKQELNSQIPTTKLFHGTSLDSLWSILDKGIQSRTRQYVHLSDSFELAKKVGSRHGKPILFEIDTKALVRNDWRFFKTEENVWLTSDIPAYYLGLPPFDFNLNQDRIDYYLRQLKIEIQKDHKLFNELDSLLFFADYLPSDDVYFKNKISNQIHRIHFTYGATNGVFPSTTTYNNSKDWAEKCLVFEQNDWFQF